MKRMSYWNRDAVYFAIGTLGMFLPLASARPDQVSLCPNIGAQLVSPSSWTSQGGQTCDSFTFTYEGATYTSSGSSCPNFLIYNPEIKNQVQKVGFQTVTVWKKKKAFPFNCVCVTQIVFCFDWECQQSGPAETLEQLQSFEESMCAGGPPVPPPLISVGSISVPPTLSIRVPSPKLGGSE